jgi:hypothetical protein
MQDFLHEIEEILAMIDHIQMIEEVLHVVKTSEIDLMIGEEMTTDTEIEIGTEIETETEIEIETGSLLLQEIMKDLLLESEEMKIEEMIDPLVIEEMKEMITNEREMKLMIEREEDELELIDKLQHVGGHHMECTTRIRSVYDVNAQCAVSM